LTPAYQVITIEPVRGLLCLESGNDKAFDIEGDDVYLRKAEMLDKKDGFEVSSAL